MALYKTTYTVVKNGKRVKRESRVWWYEFTYAGQTIRESSKTTSLTRARIAEKNRRTELERASVGLPSQPMVERIRLVSNVLDQYERTLAVGRRPKTVSTAKERLPHVRRLLGNLLLADLTAERIVEYM